MKVEKRNLTVQFSTAFSIIPRAILLQTAIGSCSTGISSIKSQSFLRVR